MRPDREQQDRLGALVLHELENDAQVIGGAARPTAGQIALELVGAQAGIERIGLGAVAGSRGGAAAPLAGASPTACSRG